MLKECLINMLKIDKETTDVFKNAKGKAKSYKQIRENVLHLLHAFLKDSERISGSFDFTIDFSKGDSLKSHTGLFSETGLFGMLEDSDCILINQASLFIEA